MGPYAAVSTQYSGHISAEKRRVKEIAADPTLMAAILAFDTGLFLKLRANFVHMW
jgi:hypothetical protein